MRLTGGIRRPAQAGLTLLEVILTMAIMAVLASVILPMAEVSATRSKEIELRRALREIRTAIDQYKDDFDRAVVENKIIAAINETGYPEELEDLVEGDDWKGLYPYKRKYLRRIPRDPFDEYDEGWGLRAYRDDPDSTIYGGEDIYDVYSQSSRIALDGTPYNTW
ncbi:MAG: type II secretion system protein [Desulfuromonadales bacterium]|nr:type II secretion system protein [Desulfuromonadales bacterium]